MSLSGAGPTELFPSVAFRSHMPFLDGQTLLFCCGEDIAERTFARGGNLWGRMARDPALRQHFQNEPRSSTLRYRLWKIYMRQGDDAPARIETGLPLGTVECSPAFYRDHDGVHLSFIAGVPNNERLVYHLYQSSGPSLQELSPATVVLPLETRLGFVSEDYLCYGEKRRIIIQKQKQRKNSTKQLDIVWPLPRVARVTFRADAPHTLIITGLDSEGIPHTLLYNLNTGATREVRAATPVYKSTIYGDQLIAAVKEAKSKDEDCRLVRESYQLVPWSGQSFPLSTRE